MEIKSEGLKVPHVPQAVGRSPMKLLGPHLPTQLAATKFARHWDMAHVRAEITADKELIFWVRGKRFESKFMGNFSTVIQVRGYPGYPYINLYGAFRDGMLTGIAVVPHDEFANSRADMSMFIRAWNNLSV